MKRFRDLMQRLGLDDDERLPPACDAAQCAVYLQRRAVIPTDVVAEARDLITNLGSANRTVALGAETEILRLIDKAAHQSWVRNMTHVNRQARRITSGSFPAIKDKS